MTNHTVCIRMRHVLVSKDSIVLCGEVGVLAFLLYLQIEMSETNKIFLHHTAW
jgi:hypothetical protein